LITHDLGDEEFMEDRSIRNRSIAAFEAGEFAAREDRLAVEEPLEIRVLHGSAENRRIRSVAVTMRTPPKTAEGKKTASKYTGDASTSGYSKPAHAAVPADSPQSAAPAWIQNERDSDVELALGFLYTEGILRSLNEVRHAGHDPDACEGAERGNVVLVVFEPGAGENINRLERHFYTSSSCGVCGKTSIEAVQAVGTPQLIAQRPRIDPAVVVSLPDRLRPAQAIFECTGGLHAAGLFDAAGGLVLMREDVGRHNAVDKIVGAALLDGLLPCSDQMLLVSGRASFELAQKAIMAGIPALVAVGAPSSLAVDLAQENGMTLMGFARDGRFNIYTGADRIQGAQVDSLS
jgi:FdhD protein